MSQEELRASSGVMFVTVPKCSLLIIKVIEEAHQHGSVLFMEPTETNT